MPKTLDGETAKADQELILQLEKLSEGGKLVRSSKYEVELERKVINLKSWRMQEHKYYSVPSPFPTLARGLFTASSDLHEKNETAEVSTANQYSDKVVREGKVDGDDDDDASEPIERTKRTRIVARGYDKFFNIGEVPWCTWNALEKHSVGPYEMTLKSNGCIIFIAALTPTRILVTSKHSTGPIQDKEISHAGMGEIWLDRHLKTKGKKREQLAQVLWDNNWTAVAELCDDEFEEHVLPYSKEQTGLHLHGINHSTGVFHTLSSDEVSKFAEEWGLLRTPYHIVQTVKEVRELAEDVAKSGKWNGQAIEGFVVRCHVTEASNPDGDFPPYGPGSSFFFKIKFDEPYLMYRDWREITKTLLSAASKGSIDEAKLPKSKQRRPETNAYVTWVKREIATNPKLFEKYNLGKGVIATRERFLKYMEDGGSSELGKITSSMNALSLEKKQIVGTKKVIIAPISIPCCGKTSIAIALSYLFNFGHVQSDDCKDRKSFLKKIKQQLSTHDVVFADKNNHLEEHRSDLRNIDVPVRVIAFYWALNEPQAMIHRFISERIVERGDNHQKLKADVENKGHEDVIWMFLKQRQELKEDEVDEVVDMEFHDSLEDNLARAINACVDLLGLEKPSTEKIGKAMAQARNYKVPNQGVPKAVKEKKKKDARFYAILPDIKLQTVIENQIFHKDVPKEILEFWDELKRDTRVEDEPHITLVHSKEIGAEQKKLLWERCQTLDAEVPPALFQMDFGHLVTDGRVLAITVNNLRPKSTSDENVKDGVRDFVDLINAEVGDKLHVTVGTRRQDISAFESRALVEKWRYKGDKAGVKSFPLKDLTTSGAVRGRR